MAEEGNVVSDWWNSAFENSWLDIDTEYDSLSRLPPYARSPGLETRLCATEWFMRGRITLNLKVRQNIGRNSIIVNESCRSKVDVLVLE